MRQLTPVSATASSVTGANVAAFAIDGLGYTRWESAYSDPQYVYVDMGSPVKMTRMTVQWQMSSSAAYTLRAADAIGAGPDTWPEVASMAYSTSGERLDVLDFFVVARYIALYSTARTEPLFGNSLWEIRIYSDDLPDPSSRIIPIGAVASGLEDVAAFPAAASYDGVVSAASRWSSAFVDPSWIYWDFGEPVFMNSVTVQWEAASARDYELQTSDDAVSWRTVASVTGNTTAGARDDVFPTFGGVGRYLRMYGTVRNLVYGYSIYEIVMTGSPVVAVLPTPRTMLGHLF